MIIRFIFTVNGKIIFIDFHKDFELDSLSMYRWKKSFYIGFHTCFELNSLQVMQRLAPLAVSMSHIKIWNLLSMSVVTNISYFANQGTVPIISFSTVFPLFNHKYADSKSRNRATWENTLTQRQGERWREKNTKGKNVIIKIVQKKTLVSKSWSLY